MTAAELELEHSVELEIMMNGKKTTLLSAVEQIVGTTVNRFLSIWRSGLSRSQIRITGGLCRINRQRSRLWCGHCIYVKSIGCIAKIRIKSEILHF